MKNEDHMYRSHFGMHPCPKQSSPGGQSIPAPSSARLPQSHWSTDQTTRQPTGRNNIRTCLQPPRVQNPKIRSRPLYHRSNGALGRRVPQRRRARNMMKARRMEKGEMQLESLLLDECTSGGHPKITYDQQKKRSQCSASHAATPITYDDKINLEIAR